MSVIQRYINRCFISNLFPLAECNQKPDESCISKSVILSKSQDIYTNLALEEWMYKNYDFTNHHVLMLWRNEPCVVIGKHQNPWLEVNIRKLKKIIPKGIQLARRNSGGGTVYHDLNTLNFTFFTTNSFYNRHNNLTVIRKAILRNYNINLEISKEHNLLLDGLKISGTAARFGRPNSYHHCTLLVDTHKQHLNDVLNTNVKNIITNATKSKKSNVTNLSERYPEIKTESLVKDICWEYLRTSAVTNADKGLDWAKKQNGFKYVDPKEENFPGITAICENFKSWDWIFGKTPKFSISNYIKLAKDSTRIIYGDTFISVSIDAGRISNITLNTTFEKPYEALNGEKNITGSLKGYRFSEDVLNILA